MRTRSRAIALALAAFLLPALVPGAVTPPPAAPALVEVEASRALRLAGDLRGAGKALDRALEIDPDCAVAWLERGLLEEATSTTTFARLRARRAFTRAFELDPRLADPLRHPEILGSRGALAAELERWKRPASPEKVAASATAIPPPTPRPPAHASAPAPRQAQVIDASNLAGSNPVNQVLPAGSSAAARNASGRRGARPQRFHPPPTVQPQPEPEPEPEPEAVIENNDEAPPPEPTGDQAVEERPSGEESGDTASEEPPPGSY